MKKILIPLLLLSTHLHYSMDRNTVEPYCEGEHSDFVSSIIQQELEALALDSTTQSAGNIAETLGTPDYKTLVLKKHGRPIGFITYSHQPFIPLSWLAPEHVAIELMAIAPNHRGSGYATYLLTCALNDACKSNSSPRYALSYVRTDNEEAQNMFTRYGFKEAFNVPWGPKKFTLPLRNNHEEHCMVDRGEQCQYARDAESGTGFDRD